MIGLGVIAHLKQAGAGLIIATETTRRRAELARKLGADYVFNSQEITDLKERVLHLTKGQGVDAVFDCSGVTQAFRSAPRFVRRGGQIVLTGMITEETPIIPVDFCTNELCLQGTSCYYTDEFPMVVEFLERVSLPIEEVITSKIKLGRVVEDGFKVLLSPNHQEIKILVEPD
jgi:threonine dehydrogenase-like Zn-dependent dehydrogenase